MIDYDHASHVYSYQGKRYLSATQLLDLVKPPFDTETVAKQVTEERGKTAEYWIKDWDRIREDSIVRGNRIHEQHEVVTMNRRTVLENGRRFLVHNPELYYCPPDEYPDGVYPEMKLWNHDYRIAGRADKIVLYTENGVRYADIDDYKTNRRLRTVSYCDKFGRYKMLEAPLDHIMHCEMEVYTLQLSIYMYMLEGFGFRPGTMRIIHFPHLIGIEPPGAAEPDPVTHELKYRRNDVETLLKHHLKVSNNGKKLL